MPQQINLDDISLSELRSLQKRIEKELESRNMRKMREKALAEAAARAIKYGFTLEELVAGTKEATGSKVRPKYRNPADESKQWSGRGRQPLWVKAHVDAGGALEDLLIK